MNKQKLKEVFQRFEVKAAVAGACLLPMTTVAFASSVTPPTFDLAAVMESAATKIVGDLLGMIAAVLPITLTLMGAAIGIAYGIRFIKGITKKAG